MKKWICMVFTLLFVLTGCKSANEMNSDAANTTPVLDLRETSANESATEEKETYAKAYYDVLTYLLDEYGVVHEEYDADSMVCVGLEYAELLDLENDGVPELICAISDGNPSSANGGGWACVFRYANGMVREILKAPYGGRMDTEDDAFLHVGNVEGTPFFSLMDIVAEDDGSEYFLERISVYTIDNGKLQCRTALGMANCKRIDEYRENTYVYTSCQVDGEMVPVEEYLHIVDDYTKEERKFDTTWYDFSEDMLVGTIERLQEFVDELVQKAKMGKIDLNGYKETRKSSKKAPYESTPFIPNDIKTELGKIGVPMANPEEQEKYEEAKLALFQQLAEQYCSLSYESLNEMLYDCIPCCEIVDFENDGLPEILFSYIEARKTYVYIIFRYSDGQFDEVLRVKSGKNFEFICTFDHQYFVFCDYESEKIKGVQNYRENNYLIKGGKVVKTCFQKMPDIGKWLINGNEVSEEEYQSKTGKYTTGEFIYCNPCFENGVSREEAAAWREAATW